MTGAWLNGVVVVRIPQSGPGRNHLVCKQLGRAELEGQIPRWMHRGSSQSRLGRQLWKVEESTVEVPMQLGKVWDAP